MYSTVRRDCLFSWGQVANLYQDSSIGNAIHIIVTRLVLLTEEQVILAYLLYRILWLILNNSYFQWTYGCDLEIHVYCSRTWRSTTMQTGHWRVSVAGSRGSSLRRTHCCPAGWLTMTTLYSSPGLPYITHICYSNIQFVQAIQLSRRWQLQVWSGSAVVCHRNKGTEIVSVWGLFGVLNMKLFFQEEKKHRWYEKIWFAKVAKKFRFMFFKRGSQAVLNQTLSVTSTALNTTRQLVC